MLYDEWEDDIEHLNDLVKMFSSFTIDPWNITAMKSLLTDDTLMNINVKHNNQNEIFDVWKKNICIIRKCDVSYYSHNKDCAICDVQITEVSSSSKLVACILCCACFHHNCCDMSMVFDGRFVCPVCGNDATNYISVG
jgi:hypothetical protein